jgi:RNA polymerase primary sigma factor
MKQLKITKTITSRDEHSIDRYFQEINKIPLIENAKEETMLAKRVKEGDKIAFDRLVSANLRFVVSVAKQYQNQGMQLADLINEGNLGLIKAAQRFDETKGYKFISYAVWWIRQSILQALAEQSRMVRLPLNRVGDLTKFAKRSVKLEQNLEREPTIEELADVMEMKPWSIVEMQRMAAKHISFQTSAQDGEEELNLLDVMVDEDQSAPDHVLMQESLQREIRASISKLPQREADVITLYFGINGHMSVDEIAGKFGIQRERVRQIKERGLRILRKQSVNLESFV